MAPIRKIQRTVPTGDRGRDIFNRIKAAHPGKIVQPSFLRSEVVLKNGRPVYEFSFVKDGNSDSVTERKLDRNDEFVISTLGLMWAHRVVGREGNETLRVNEIYPAVVDENNNADHVGENNGSMAILYNGSLAITVGQTKFLEALDTYAFRSEASATLRDAGFIELTPQVLLQGSQKNTISLTLPASSGMDVEGGTVKVKDATGTLVDTPCKHVVVLFARGYLITKK